MRLAIYPPIGFGRLGDSPDGVVIARERAGAREQELDSHGNEIPVQNYKDGNLKVKRVAARFRVFEFPDNGGDPRPLDTSGGVAVEWTVHLVNRKNGVVRTSTPPSTSAIAQPLTTPGPTTIDPGSRTIQGAGASGQIFDSGNFLSRIVSLGELRTDAAQNLLVLGGSGFSSSPANDPLQSFYSNAGWHDDTSDGPVTARVTLANGTVVTNIDPAWAVIGPPDFAPDIEGVVTLYDIVSQVGADHFGVPLPAPLSFSRDIYPLLHRTAMLRWVNNDPNWTDISTDYAALADRSAAAAPGRANAAFTVRETQFVLTQFHLTDVQTQILDRYENGDFTSDWSGPPDPAGPITPAGLTRAALDSTVGQGFFPGIEAGRVMSNHNIYSSPFEFRIDHSAVEPGGLTALMAVPWQADFLACNRNWWPAQRPNDVRTDPVSTLTKEAARGIDNFAEMVQKFSKLGFITPQTTAGGEIVYAEVQRNPSGEFA